MRIAFLSYEFPPDTGGGGIATYLLQAGRMLVEAGHEVEIFAGTPGASPTQQHADGYVVHRVASKSSPTFLNEVVDYFTDRHAQRPFDVVEGNDFDASALGVRQALPDLPCVVKLHTPRFLVDQLHWHRPTAWQRWRMAMGALRRGQRPVRSTPPLVGPTDVEVRQLALADEIASPSQAIADRLVTLGCATTGRISVFPYPYRPPSALLSIAPGTTTGRVMFLGRLEERKGVFDLARAIPLVLARCPTAKFRFVGRNMRTSDGRGDTRAIMANLLGRSASAVEFLDAVPAARVPELLAECDILVAPSHWESFGLVCCEGMAAARAVVGSRAGGMSEILDDCGALISPQQPTELAAVLGDLLTDPNRREALGKAARARVLRHYSHERLLPLQIASYERARAVAAARIATRS